MGTFPKIQGPRLQSKATFGSRPSEGLHCSQPGNSSLQFETEVPEVCEAFPKASFTAQYSCSLIYLLNSYFRNYCCRYLRYIKE